MEVMDIYSFFKLKMKRLVAKTIADLIIQLYTAKNSLSRISGETIVENPRTLQ